MKVKYFMAPPGCLFIDDERAGAGSTSAETFRLFNGFTSRDKPPELAWGERRRVMSESTSEGGRRIVDGMWGVRYQVKDVRRSIDFYTGALGFKLDFKTLPAFGQVSLPNLKLILSGPGAS